MSYKPRSKTLAPIWRGVGLILIIGLTGGSWLLTGWFLDWNRATKPTPFPILIGITRGMTEISGYQIPNVYIIQGVVMLAFAVLMYSIIFMVWAATNTGKKNPLDADPIRRKIDHSKTR